MNTYIIYEENGNILHEGEGEQLTIEKAKSLAAISRQKTYIAKLIFSVLPQEGVIVRAE